MKIAATIAGALLGLAFITFGVNYFVPFLPQPTDMPPPPPEAASFMSALLPTGYMGMVKFFEILGGVLVAIPRTRNLGLLVLGPILINIAATNHFLMKNPAFGGPIVLGLSALALFLLVAERRAWSGLVNR